MPGSIPGRQFNVVFRKLRSSDLLLLDVKHNFSELGTCPEIINFPVKLRRHLTL